MAMSKQLSPDEQFQKYFHASAVPIRDSKETTLYLILPDGSIRMYNNRLEYCEKTMMCQLNERTGMQEGIYTIYVAATPCHPAAIELIEWIQVISQSQNVRFHFVFGLLNYLSHAQHLHNSEVFDAYLCALLLLISFSQKNPHILTFEIVSVPSYNRLASLLGFQLIRNQTELVELHSECMDHLQAIQDPDMLLRTMDWVHLPKQFLSKYFRLLP